MAARTEKAMAASKLHSRIICCKIWISESRNRRALDAIEAAVAQADAEVVIANRFPDEPYNRVRYTLVSYFVPGAGGAAGFSPMRHALYAMVQAAFAAVNLLEHSGAHPRIGVVDHICFHPLLHATVDDAACLAKLVAADIGAGLQVPVYLYEAAHREGKALDEIRRQLGFYRRPNGAGYQWAGWTLPEMLPARPDEGPVSVDAARGITVIGASPWVEHFNVPVLSADIAAARRVAQRVRARGGAGLPSVQALALAHGEGRMEVVCILLEPNVVGADAVERRAEEAAAAEGLAVEKGYFTDIPQAMILERYIKMVTADLRR